LGWALPEDIGEVVGFFRQELKKKEKRKKEKEIKI